MWVYVSQEKWDKAKIFVSDLMESLSLLKKGTVTPSEFLDICLDHKHLEKGLGFLVYFSRTYTSLLSYLKGIHLTLDLWRDNQDSEGWN